MNKEEKIKNIALYPMTEELAYKLGRDKAKNGANEVNCNFRIFSKPEFTKAWERGANSNPNPLI